MDQLSRGLRIERVEPHDRQLGRGEQGIVPGLTAARREDHRHGVRVQPAGREEQRVPRFHVQPLDVVHGEQEGVALGGDREQQQHRDLHSQAVHHFGGRREAAYPAQRCRLTGRQRVEVVRQRPHDL